MSTEQPDNEQHFKVYDSETAQSDSARKTDARSAHTDEDPSAQAGFETQDQADWTQTQRRSGGSATPEEALAKAMQHARSAVSEILQAIGHLIDATALASTNPGSSTREWLDMAQRALGSLGNALDERPKSNDAHAVDAVLDALDQEIQRWQTQAESSPEARAVLRAYLGLREILWEFGFRRSAPKAQTQQSTQKRDNSTKVGTDHQRKTQTATRPKRGRVQRIPVEE